MDSGAYGAVPEYGGGLGKIDAQASMRYLFLRSHTKGPSAVRHSAWATLRCSIRAVEKVK